MIAMIAPRRICSLKLAETFLTPTEVASSCLRAASCRFVCSPDGQRLGLELELLVAAVLGSPRPWMTASARPIVGASGGRPRPSAACGVLNEIWLPPLKSMPRLSPWKIERPDADQDDRAGDREPELGAPMKSIRCQAGIFCALAPMNAGLLNQRKPARTPSSARVAATAVTIERSVPIEEHEGEALDARRRDGEEDERGDHRHDVRVDDRVEALAVAARRWRRARICPRAPLP